MATFHQVQAQPFALSGAGAVAGATSIVLKSFGQINGTLLTMANFGSVGYLTMEPGNGTLEEQVSFTGVVQNSNGTATLSGIKTVLDVSPYTETSGLAQTHAGSTTVVLSNTAGFYNQFPAKANDETITGQWTFNNTPIVPGTVSDASTTVKGVSKTSVAPAVAANPIVVGDNDSRVNALFYGASATGTDAYAITVTGGNTPAAYATGQVFTFKADVVNTGAATLAVNALGAKTIKKNVSSDLANGDIAASQLVEVQYDGTNFQIISLKSSLIPTRQVFTSTGTWTKPAGLLYAEIEVQGPGAGGGADGGGRGAGGSAGGYSFRRVAGASLGTTEAATVGTKGTGGTAGNSGGNGSGASSFGTWAVGNAGAGGVLGSKTSTIGGTASAGDLNLSGQGGAAGGPGGSATSPSSFGDGKGGDSYFGKGGPAVANQSTTSGGTGNAASGYGAGGSGGVTGSSSGTAAGGDGTDGIVIVTEYYQ